MNPSLAQPVTATHPRRMRIAVLNRNFLVTGGGAERYSIALVEQLALRHEIHVFAQRFDQPVQGVTHHSVPLLLERPRWINQLWFAMATWWLTRRGFDVVHSHENTWHGLVQTVHVLPVKYTLFHGLLGWGLAFRWLKVLTSPRLLAYLLLERSRYQAGDGRAVVVTSESLRDVMAHTYPVAQSALRVLTPGVSKIPKTTDAATQSAARSSLGLPQTGKCLLFVGNDYQKKGLLTLLRALEHVPADCYVTVVGNAAQTPKFAAEAKATGLADRVHFLGALKNIEVAYQAADCLVHPTLEDTFAMVVLEAMSFGLAVIVSGEKFCGISATLSHAINALILDDPRDAGALAAAIQQVTGDAHAARQLGDAAKRFAQDHLWSTVAREQEAIYTAVANLRFKAHP